MKRRVLRAVRLALTGSKNANWRGGRTTNNGYVLVRKPGHHRAVLYGKTPYVMRSVLVLERKLGRKLTKHEVPHHKNRNKQDDRPSNLQALDKRKHVSEHMAGKSNEERKRGV